MAPTLYLASASPRRRELLASIGVTPVVVSVDVDETPLPGESPEVYVVRLARAKAAAGVAGGVGPVLGADTVVVRDGEILGKPRDQGHGVAMLLSLAGRAHQVLTAVCVAGLHGEDWRLSCTEVRFRAISHAEAEAYWHTGEPADKAGGYGIQGYAAVFAEHLSGSYSGVVGLPLYETAELLRGVGIPLWDGRGGPA